MRRSKDPDFLAEADKAQLEIAPVDGETLQAMVERMFKSPPDIVAGRPRRRSARTDTVRQACRDGECPVRPGGNFSGSEGRDGLAAASAIISLNKTRYQGA